MQLLRAGHRRIGEPTAGRPRGIQLAQALFELYELANETEVGGDDGSLVLDELVSLAHGLVHVLHHVGDDHGGRPGDACMAVDEYTGIATSGLLCFKNNVVGNESVLESRFPLLPSQSHGIVNNFIFNSSWVIDRLNMKSINIRIERPLISSAVIMQLCFPFIHLLLNSR